jgi:hypothetical protein
VYAITETGFRAISNPSDLKAGEVLSDEIPQALMLRAEEAEARDMRSRLLRASDWTQIPDNNLTALERASWSAYRQLLRDVPQQAGFPLSVQWPTVPSARPDVGDELPQQS